MTGYFVGVKATAGFARDDSVLKAGDCGKQNRLESSQAVS